MSSFYTNILWVLWFHCKRHVSFLIPSKLYKLTMNLEFFDNYFLQVGDPAGLQEKIRKMVDGGTSNLQFIVDFDYTLTRSHK